MCELKKVFQGQIESVVMSSQVCEGGPLAGVPLFFPFLEDVLERLQELGQELLQELGGALLALGLMQKIIIE